ncbi:inner membrane complex protein IMC2A [Toxoplasma gondii ARI]|uniref:Inner membrane complex protein IMC2A n=1 Tax=Toxoplasma gondii ARI TaxID=1074872 RepID=A0A139XXI7_TOXGO|nr:inner membrane complex protein IMC2A [Toxoplasma gondii ARI]
MERRTRPDVSPRWQARRIHFVWLTALAVPIFLLFPSLSLLESTSSAGCSGIQCFASFPGVAAGSTHSREGADPSPQETLMQPRRLSGIIKTLVLWDPVQRLMPSLNLDSVVFVAGKHKADRSAAFHTTMDDVMTLLLRWFNEKDKPNWLLQGFVTEAALFREHVRYQDQMIHEQTQNQSEQQPTDPQAGMDKVLNIEVYTYLAGAKRRVRDWICDGNTFMRTGEEGSHAFKQPFLTERDVGFLRGLPYNVLRVARGVYSKRLPASVKRLQEELFHRGIRTLNDLLLKTNLMDLFVLFDIMDESFTQIDVLREFSNRWKKYRAEEVVPPLLPPGNWEGERSIEELMRDDHYPSMKFPRCTMLKCVMQDTWSKNAVETITVEKKDTNSLKLLLIGNTGIGEYKSRAERKGLWYKLKRFLWTNEFDQTVSALAKWHAEEKADAVLGLGDFLGIPGPLSARDERFTKRWYDIFVKDAKLDIPWLMTLGEEEALVNPSASVRHHYTGEHPNWYMPNDAYTATFSFSTSMTMANGTIQHEAFNATVINVNTWNLFVGNPIANNMQSMMDRLMWLSDQLYTAVNQTTNWLIIMGHLPLVSTGPQGEQGRLQYVDDLYKNGQPRGPEAVLIQMLLSHYQVDLYVSAHDHFMEYVALEDLSKNTTTAFITSGAAVRLLDKDVGRGWIGRLRGALYPILCWSGRRILYAFHPGGCHPERWDQNQAYRFFAPVNSQYKVNIVERVTKATGFAALRLTKDYLVAEFIDSRSKKLAGRRASKRSNKDQRDIQFMDPVAEGRLRYDELEAARSAFADANEERISKEIQFARQCPILAQRIKFYQTEINDLVSKYDQIGKQKDAYEVMDDNTIEILLSEGVNVVSRIAQAVSEMNVLAGDYDKMVKKYRELIDLKDTMPAADDPRYAQLFQLEKAYIDARKMRQQTARELAVGRDGMQDREGEKDLERMILNMQMIRREIVAVENDIKANPFVPSEEQPEEGKVDVNGAETPEGGDGKEPLPAIKYPDDSLEARIERKREQLQKHEHSLAALKRASPEDREKIKMRIVELERLVKGTQEELAAMQQRLQRQQQAMRPSRVWQLLQRRQDLETKLLQIKILVNQVEKLPEETRTSPDARAQVERLTAQRVNIEKDIRDISDELGTREPTELEKQCLDKKASVWRAELVLAQESLLSEKQRSIPVVRDAVHAAKRSIGGLRRELEELTEKVKVELRERDAAFDAGLEASRVPPPEAEGRKVTPVPAPHVQANLETQGGSRADALMHEFNGGEDEIAVIDEAIRVSPLLSPEERAELENLVGPVQDLPQKKADLEKRLAALKDQAEQEAQEANVDPEEKRAGSGSRRLFELFEPKKEPTPYKQLEPIDLGPVDSCLQVPMLEYHVEIALHPTMQKYIKDKCIFIFAQMAYQTQYRVIQPVHLYLRSHKGLQTLLYRVPSVHVFRAWNQFFGSMHNTRFKSLLKTLKKGLKFVHETFKPVGARGEALEASEHEAITVSSTDAGEREESKGEADQTELAQQEEEAQSEDEGNREETANRGETADQERDMNEEEAVNQEGGASEGEAANEEDGRYTDNERQEAKETSDREDSTDATE